MAARVRDTGSGTPTVLGLRSQAPEGQFGFDSSTVRLSWRIDGVLSSQTAYQVQVARTPGFDPILADTGPVARDQQIGVVAPGGSLSSRETRSFRVRVEAGSAWSEWSQPLQIEAGLLEADDWVARAITLPDDPGSAQQSASPLVRRELVLQAEPVRARLHITSLGVHRATINGAAVTDELLAPGWTSYRNRLLAATHDVTHLLRTGPNVISAALGDGWYRGRLGWEPGEDRRRYGREVGLIAQLEIDLADGTFLMVVTDETWRAGTGAIRMADLYDGSTIDLNLELEGWDKPGFDASGWSKARVVPYDPSTIRPRMTPPVRVVETMTARRIGEAGDEIIFDIGQNVAGLARLRVRGGQGEVVTVRHAEVLESDGSLHTKSLRSALATDRYVLGDFDGPTELEPEFTFHGFRYLGIRTAAAVDSVEVDAISSDLRRRGTFECSLPLLNKLHENVVWSQLGNFVSVPTDCPQRDERLGWTGDAQAFAPTASTLFDSEAFWVNWLEDLAADQDPVLGVPSVVPDVVLRGEARFGRAGWADAATIVPWSVFESYGDPEILVRQFESMHSWLDSLQRRRAANGLLEPGFQFGDWLDPDAPPARPWEAKADSQFLANAFFAQSARLTAAAAEVVGKAPEIHQELSALAAEMARLTWGEWRDHIYETQTGCAIALRFGIVPEEERVAVGDALAEMVRAADGRISTGFLGTPHVLHALAEHGRFEEAYMMLLRESHPSWLYQVLNDATTVWERWDAITVDGSIHPGRMDPPPDLDPDGEGGHMLSFNHYAYGAVVDWIYRYLAGIAPDPEQPGYRHVVLAPKPVAGVEWVCASVESGYGTISTRWEVDSSGGLRAEVSLPSGVTGSFVAPVGSDSVVTLNGSPIAPSVDLSAGTHEIVVAHPALSLSTKRGSR